MEYTIRNEQMAVTADTFGAQLISIRKDGRELMWGRDASYWEDCSPNIFPYVARLTEGRYTYDGKSWSMRIHGFVKYKELSLVDQQADRMTFELKADEETLAEYPWHFVYRISYILEGSVLSVVTEVTNEDDRTMYYGLGGHPGFAVPMEEGLSYEDYYLELPEAEAPRRLIFTEACFRTGEDVPYAFKEGRRIPLSHDLFDEDAIVLKDAGHKAVLASDKGTKGLVIRWEHDYLGIWSMPHRDAPYICVEPWASLPARDGVIEDFAKQPDLQKLQPGETSRISWSVEALD